LRPAWLNYTQLDVSRTFARQVKVGIALDVIAGKKARKKARKVEPLPTLNGHSTKAYSEFYEACAKAVVPAEIKLLEAALERMRDDLHTACNRPEQPAGTKPTGKAPKPPG
jgi:hypothetical protein